MTQEQNTTAISIMHPVCCGLDVHKMKISACLITIDSDGQEQSEIKEFGAFTDDLISLRGWLTTNNCPIIAMESTGVYWRPVHNVLEHLSFAKINPWRICRNTSPSVQRLNAIIRSQVHLNQTTQGEIFD